MVNFRFLEFLQQLSGHRWLRAIRNSLVLLLPVTFVGAISLLLASIPLSAVLPQVVGDAGSALAMLVSDASHGILALCLVVLISHYLAVEARETQLVEISPPLVATVALVNFFIFARLAEPVTSLSILGARSVLAGILVSIFSAEVFFFCMRVKSLRLGRRTYDLDPSLHLAIRAIAPAISTVVIFLLASWTISQLTPDLSQLASSGLASLGEMFGSQLPGLLLLGVLHQLLWFVGIHGANVLEGIYHLSFDVPANAGQVFDIPRRFLDLYVHIGGSGSTLGLLLAILLFVKKGEATRVAKYALLPSLFNINELVLFGLPIVFNPIYLIPFLLAPLAQTVLGYACVRYGLVAVDITQIPWTTPPLLAGLLNSGSWRGGALQLLCIALSALVYLPFVRFAERQKRAETLNNVRRAVDSIEAIKQQQRTVLNRHDDIGHTARKLLHEFMQDIGSRRVFLAYQPQHDRSGAVVSVEGLLRWQHRHFGFIPPGVICSLAEESGQIIPLGRWVIATACEQLRCWKQAGIRNLRVSVNLSPVQLKDAGLLAHVKKCLRANQLSAAELGLELTESLHVPDDVLSTQTLKDLEMLGIPLEMDDFGMGYSSMLYIRRFHFDAIKLDGLLTRDVLQDNNCRDIIASVVQLGHALGIRVVAEYVETREQQALLEQLGCTVFQGYLYSPALAGAQCLDYLQEHAHLAATGTSGAPDIPTPTAMRA